MLSETITFCFYEIGEEPKNIYSNISNIDWEGADGEGGELVELCWNLLAYCNY
jgi:hypothetical protein